MTNFYKGVSELPNGKDPSWSQKIRSKKIRAQLTELTTSFQLYFAYIFKALVKYSLSTDIVLFTQSLRKEVYKRKMYYKSAWQVVENYWLKSWNLPAAKWRRSGVKEKYSSDFLLTNLWGSGCCPLVLHGLSFGFSRRRPKTIRRYTCTALKQRQVLVRCWSVLGLV